MEGDEVKLNEAQEEAFEKVLKVMLIAQSSEKSLLTHLKENLHEQLDEILYDVGYTPAPRHQPFCYPRKQVELILDSVPSIFPYHFNFENVTREQKQRLLEIANLGTPKAIRRDEVASIIGKAMPYFIKTCDYIPI